LSVVCCVEAAFFFAFDSVGTGLEAVNVPPEAELALAEVDKALERV